MVFHDDQDNDDNDGDQDDDDDVDDEEGWKLHSWLSSHILTSIPPSPANHKEFNKNFQ